MKNGELVVVVDMVEEAVKFYTEKLMFDIIDLSVDTQNAQRLQYARLHKGKCFISFRKPHEQEFAEFSLIKRCASRSVGLDIEIKKDLPKYFEKCQKKDITIIQPLHDVRPGVKSFTLVDPFGIKLVFTEVSPSASIQNLNVLGLNLDKNVLANKQEAEKAYLESIATQAKRFGILRRSSKKFAKSKIRDLVKALKK